MGIWDGDQWHWDFKWRRNLYQWEITSVNEVLSLVRDHTPIIGKSDEMVWQEETNKQYSVKSFTENVGMELYQPIHRKPVIDFIWQNKCPTRAQLTLWFLALNRLKTGNLMLHL